MPPSEPKNNVMSAMQKLQHLSLINKVTKELDKSLGVNDKTLAEFVVDVAKSSKFDQLLCALSDFKHFTIYARYRHNP